MVHTGHTISAVAYIEIANWKRGYMNIFFQIYKNFPKFNAKNRMFVPRFVLSMRNITLGVSDHNPRIITPLHNVHFFFMNNFQIALHFEIISWLLVYYCMQ